MAKAIPRGPLFRLEGIEPSGDVAWHLAGPSAHLAYWRVVGAYGLVVKDRSLSLGLDVAHRKMKISDRTRRNRRSAMGPAYAYAPALTPSFEASRTRSYLRAEADARGVTFWWRFDARTKASWGVILEYQKRAGRDVIGLSAIDRAKVQRYADRWWAANRERLALRGLGARHAEGTHIILAPPPTAAKIPAAPRPRAPIAPKPTPTRAPVAVDLSRYSLTDADAARVARAAAAGTFTGFRRRER